MGPFKTADGVLLLDSGEDMSNALRKEEDKVGHGSQWDVVHTQTI